MTRVSRRGLRRPYVRKRRSYKVRRNVRKRRNVRTRRRRVPFTPVFRNPFINDKLRTSLIYNQNISLDPKPDALGAGGSNQWVFSAIGCYDPDVTGTGHQPLYFDNLSSFYQRYRVMSSMITVTVLNRYPANTTVWNGTAAASVPAEIYKLAIAYDESDNATDYTAYMNTLLEEGGKQIRWRFVNSSFTGSPPRLTHYCVPYKATNLAWNDDTLISATNNVPSRKLYYYVFITSADGSSDPPAVALNVRIKYNVEFFDRVLAQTEN